MITKIALVILAGGQGNRMGFLSNLAPKPMLHVLDESLLIRQIKQAQAAGLKNIVVTTRKKYYKKIESELKIAKLEVTLIQNPKHKLGSLPALLYILDKIKIDNIIMSFADIYFIENPFRTFLKNIGSQKMCFMGISNVFHKKDLSNGGIIFLDNNNNVVKIIEKPSNMNNKGLRWNGLAFFDRRNKLYLKKFLDTNSLESPEGDFFEYVRRLGTELKGILCSDFININEPQDLIVASLYRIGEVSNDSSKIKIAKRLREKFLLNK